MAELPEPLPKLRLNNYNSPVSSWLPRDDDRDRDIFDAPYQRQSVWDLVRRRNLIKSLLMGLPVGAVIYAKLPYGTLPGKPSAYRRIIDGKQRVETLHMFARDKFTIPGWWLNPTDGADDGLRGRDVVYSDMPDPIRLATFENAQLPGMEFDSFVEYIPNPHYDPLVKYGKGNGWKDDDPRLRRYLPIQLTNEQALRREAELYLLINFGGVPQTEEDRARAASHARSSDA